MSKQPEGGNSPKDTSAKPGKPAVKSDTFTQVSDKDSDKVKGGRMGQTDNATKETAFCCGE